jgi:hypothetical protein
VSASRNSSIFPDEFFAPVKHAQGFPSQPFGSFSILITFAPYVFATFSVASVDWSLTRIISCGLNVWVFKDSKSLSRFFSSFLAGIIIEML